MSETLYRIFFIYFYLLPDFLFSFFLYMLRPRALSTGGNVGNKFSIDMHTGELTSRPLDRETHSRYFLQITAQDRGTPVTYQGQCNISVIVEDQNDNDPRFEMAKYVATIPEDAPIGTSVLTVKAIDGDLGINARIIYSLANETEWLFSIDNRSGLITTAGWVFQQNILIFFSLCYVLCFFCLPFILRFKCSDVLNYLCQCRR